MMNLVHIDSRSIDPSDVPITIEILFAKRTIDDIARSFGFVSDDCRIYIGIGQERCNALEVRRSDVRRGVVDGVGSPQARGVAQSKKLHYRPVQPFAKRHGLSSARTTEESQFPRSVGESKLRVASCEDNMKVSKEFRER